MLISIEAGCAPVMNISMKSLIHPSSSLTITALLLEEEEEEEDSSSSPSLTPICGADRFRRRKERWIHHTLWSKKNKLSKLL